jgi:hypothetical protein
MSIQEKKINTFNDYLDIIDGFSRQPIYRGHSDGKNWHLIHSLARLISSENIDQLETYNDWQGLEDHLIGRFQRAAQPYLENVPQTRLEWIVLGQHYGLPTRLLDWTENPLVALFFALIDEKNTESAVWIIEPGTYTTLDIDIENIKCLWMFFPCHIDKRIISQKGCFTIEPLPKEIIQIKGIDEHFEDYDSTISSLTKVIIPNDKKIKENLLLKLMDLGVDNNFVFPDMEGLTRQIKFDFLKNRDRN